MPAARTALLPCTPLIDPVTGLAVHRKDGRPVFVIAGGEGDEPPPEGDKPEGDKPAGSGKSGDGEDALGDAGKKALQTERDARKAAEKRASEAEAKLTAAERAKLGDKERAEAERDDARKDAERLRSENARLRIGAKYGLSADDLDDLSTDGTPEQFDARARRYAERLKGEKKNDDGSGLPPAPNASQQDAGRPSGRDAGKAEAARRFGTKQA